MASVGGVIGDDDSVDGDGDEKEEVEQKKDGRRRLWCSGERIRGRSKKQVTRTQPKKGSGKRLRKDRSKIVYNFSS